MATKRRQYDLFKIYFRKLYKTDADPRHFSGGFSPGGVGFPEWMVYEVDAENKALVFVPGCVLKIGKELARFRFKDFRATLSNVLIKKTETVSRAISTPAPRRRGIFSVAFHSPLDKSGKARKVLAENGVLKIFGCRSRVEVIGDVAKVLDTIFFNAIVNKKQLEPLLQLLEKGLRDGFVCDIDRFSVACRKLIPEEAGYLLNRT